MGGLLSSALVLTRSPEGWDGPGLVHTRPWQSGRVSAGLQAMAYSPVAVPDELALPAGNGDLQSC